MADYKQCRECIKQDTCTFRILKSKEIDCQYFIDKDVVPRSEIEKAKQEVASDIFGKIHKEIELALDSNYKAKKERIEKYYNGMSGVSDDFISLVDGKISALRGIDDFIDELQEKQYKGA